MVNKTLSGQEAKQKLLEGIKIINEAVSSTLGPAGRNVLIENEDGSIRITKDGVSVANSIKTLEDPITNIAVQLIKQVANKSADKAGDGTTTSTLLASIIVEEGMKAITQGSNPVEVKLGIDKAVKLVVDKLRDMSTHISDENKQLKQVATLSANNDEEIGEIITKALKESGKDGLVAIEESRTGETSLECVQGMAISRGYLSPYFVTDNTTLQAVLPKARVLIYDGIINSSEKEMVPFWNFCAKDAIPLLVICHDMTGDALPTFLLNKARGTLKGAVVKGPYFEDRRTQVLQDIALLTGGEVLSKDAGKPLGQFFKPEFAGKIDDVLGEARMITVGKDTTTIIDGKGDEDKLADRLLEIKAQIEKPNISNFEKEYLQERLAKLVGGVAIIHVGAPSQVELGERKDRVDDALHATRASLEEGIVPGGGIALVQIARDLEDYSTGNANENLGIKIVLKAISAPFKRILTNAGIENTYEILSRVSGWNGYNVKTGIIEDFFQTGVIDPTKVTRCALENAASVAGTILTTESVIYLDGKETKDEDKFGGMEDYM